MDKMIVLITIAAFLVIGALVGIIAKLVNKKDDQENELNLINDIENGDGIDVEVFEKLPMRIIKKHAEIITRGNVEILQDCFNDKEMSRQDILEIVDKELAAINSLKNEPKKAIVYNLFVYSCVSLDLEKWLPVIAEMLFCINQEDSFLENNNETYNLMVDIVINSEQEFSSEEFIAAINAYLNSIEEEDGPFSEERKNEISEILTDFVFVIEEEIKKQKAG